MPGDLDPFLCTHLIFAFASMSNNQIVAKNLQDETVLYPEFNRLKERYVRCVLEFSDLIASDKEIKPTSLITLKIS